jgi:hypothetical protein
MPHRFDRGRSAGSILLSASGQIWMEIVLKLVGLAGVEPGRAAMRLSNSRPYLRKPVKHFLTLRPRGCALRLLAGTESLC